MPVDKEAIQMMMVASVSHHQSSIFCANQAREKKEIEKDEDFAVYFTAVAYELTLLSIEQSLKLVLALFSIPFEENTSNHKLHSLYKQIQEEGENLPKRIIKEVNFWAYEKKYNLISKEELETCLENNNDTYAKTRYLFVNKQGKAEDFPKNWKDRRDGEILTCLRQGLVSLNMKELNKRGIKHPTLRAV